MIPNYYDFTLEINTSCVQLGCLRVNCYAELNVYSRVSNKHMLIWSLHKY